MKKRLKGIIVSLFLIIFSICFIKEDAFAIEAIKEIKGFESFDINENALHLTIENKPSLEELKGMLPDTLGVYLDDSVEVEYIDVDWFCVAEDYENCDNFYFQFSPCWDESEYVLAEDINLLIDAPYVAVFFTTEEEAASLFSVTNNSNEEKIFKYLTETMGYNIAAACGVMANIYCESAFIPTNLENSYERKLGFTDVSYTYAVDSGSYNNFVRDTAGYGLCQWTFWTRKQGLLDFAKSQGKSIGDLTMQMGFMHKEITDTATDIYAREIPNTSYGAYKVGYYYCEKYERPAQTADEKSVYRGNLAMNSYWPEYCDVHIDYSIKLSGQNVPDTLVTGTSFSVKGKITSGAALTSVAAGVYDHNGKLKTGVDINPKATSFDLSKISSSITFQNLEPGIYTYKLIVKNAKQTERFIDQKFVVLNKSQKIGNGIYMIEPKGNNNLVIDVTGHSNSSGAKLSLSYKEKTDYQFFEITYVGSGYYTLKNCATGMFMDVTDSKAANSVYVQQKKENGGSSQKWQFISSGDGYYWMVPQCATKFFLNAQNAGQTKGAGLQIYEPTLSRSQSFKLIKGELHEIFNDIKTYHWFYDYVKFVYEKDMMTGVASEGLFKPNDNVTRAQVITTLYRLSGSPKVTDYEACNVFSDVEKDMYYTDAICWAYKYEIATGNPETGKFNTTEAVTRQQLSAFFYRYTSYMGFPTLEKGDLSSMLNADKVSSYALETMEWSVGNGLISGSKVEDTDGTVKYDLAPTGTATRAQLAAILYRFCEYYEL